MVAVGSLDPRLVQGLVSDPSQLPASQADVHLDVREIDALRRLEVDGVVGPEAATLAEPLVALFRGEMTTGDDLRLPPPANHTGSAVRAAVNRLLMADRKPAAVSQDAIRKEAQMLSVLKAFSSTAARISGRAHLASRF